MYNKRTKINTILANASVDYETTVMGWVRTFRNNQFISLNDGSTIDNLQVVVPLGKIDDDTVKRITTGASIKATGIITSSVGKGQQVELVTNALEILGDSDPTTYPLQPKKHSLEYLREHGNMRFRTNTFGAVFRIRHAVSFAIHQYFNDRGFFYLHSPIITANDAEGAGEMFSVTTLPLDGTAVKTPTGEVDYSKDFFAEKTALTVSGQLEGELAACGLGQIYTFGPTFRAENSNTTRHLAEFWMVEPEVAFNDLEDNIVLAEDFIKYVIQYVLQNCNNDLTFLEQRLIDEEKNKPQQERSELPLKQKLNFVVDNDFVIITYTEAIDILKNSNANKKKKFKYPVDNWGIDLQTEHERFLVEQHFKKPVVVTNYPKEIKAFYMRVNDDDKTVAAMDILVPGIGEIVGGSQREERYERLVNRMNDMHVSTEALSFYLDTRRYGTVVHSGFGLGLERLMLFITGMGNIRDVIPFPRYPGSCKY